jgi:hypothetical protein
MTDGEMAIPETQLDTWAHQGSITNSSSTYNAIKNVLQAPDAPYVGREYEVFLQGSYGNDTNIWAESDVDIVIQLNSTFYSDIEKLTKSERTAWDAAYVDGTYTNQGLKHDVMQVLTKVYGADVSGGDKAIAIAARGNRRKADVIVANAFRRYIKFNGLVDESYIPGMCFWNKNGTRIPNYPKLHSTNLTVKHQATGSWLKPMIRIFKNLRSRLVDDGILNPGIAPSYYLEGLLYNVPTEKFVDSYAACFINCINWIQQESVKSDLVCANEQYYLLREGSLVCWAPANADAFLNAAIKLWNEW